MPAAGVPATFRSSTAPLYRRYASGLGTSATVVPSLEELHHLVHHLQTFRQDWVSRAQTLADERRAMGSSSVHVKQEDDTRAEESDSDADWAPNDRVQRTYSRAHRKREEASGSESDVPLHAVQPKPKTLGVKLRVMDDAHKARPEAVPEKAPLVPSAGVIDLRGDTFHDATTFSWDAPSDPQGSFLPKREPMREIRPYPTHPYDVHEDFANTDWHDREAMYTVPGHVPPSSAARPRPAKEAAQVPATTFFHYVDAYFKPVTEDDLAWLSSQADDPSPYVFPELGVHYRKIWEKEDAELQSVLQAMEGHAPTQPPWRPAPPSAPEDSPFVPSNTTLDALSDAQMYDPSTRGGPLMERLAASLMTGDAPEPNAEAPTDAPDALDPHVSLVDMETHVRHACESIGLLETGAPIHWDEHGDSLIASTLRLAQARLRQQSRANELRKARLFHIAQDRMAYQDYQACLQAVDREIEANWTKRQRQIKASVGKKRKTDAEAGPNKPQLSESLPDALQRRKKLKAALEPLFAHIPHACAPPTESIYQGIDT